jgi:anti-anti-sigma regulatory factor
MDIQVRSVESDLICLSCRGMISHPLAGGQGVPLHIPAGEGWEGMVLVNMHEAEYIDSSGIGWLLGLYRQVAKAGGVFALCAVPPRIADVLRLCQLDRVFSIWKDEDSARAALKRSSAQGPAPSSPAAPSTGATEGA